MNIQDVRDMVEYNYWANRRILSMAGKVTSEQFDAPSSHSFSSLHATLVHTMDAEWSWRLVLQGQGFQPDLKPADFPTVAAIEQRWREEEQAMWNFIDGLRDEDLTRIVSYQTDTGVLRERLLWHCFFHIVNHGMQHRSEAANLLTVYNQSPGDIDFTVFLNDRLAKQKQQG